ncbi:MAG: S-methyl-5-thioribose-1-phosphate isomerase [Gammaproteobacteria bacterium]|nr:S-methyl-5-thioribose-1-phosphate isomerase [Gammaproteobacteria bacterium]
MTAPLSIRSIRWKGGKLSLLDQRKLPDEVVYVEQSSAATVAAAIRDMQVRGAPAIGIAAAYGLALEAQDASEADVCAKLAAAAERLVAARPTAVNLSWAVARVIEAAQASSDPRRAAVEEAEAIYAEDKRMCRAIGEHGVKLIRPQAGILTHCNAGALAVSELGTATAPMYLAHDAGVPFRIFVDETRPLLQGARLTAWELTQAGIDVTLICDNMAAHLMAQREIDMVIVGTDRVTANGDVINKIGTRSLAVNCKYHDVPFYVACPSSTYDPFTASGNDVQIEERPSIEITGSIPTVRGISARNPAFDVTPAELVSAWITDKGVIDTASGLERLR